MSIRAGRVFLATTLAALVVGGVWLALVLMLTDPWSGATVLPTVLVLVATVFLICGALLLSRFVEAVVDERNVTIRFVLGRARVIPVSEIDEVLVVQQLLLPARTGAASSRRLILRHGDKTLAAFTPRESKVVESLRSRGCRVTSIAEPLTAMGVWRRYRHGVSLAELVVGATPWLAIIFAIGVMLWVLGAAASG